MMNAVLEHNVPSTISCAHISSHTSKQLIAYGTHSGSAYVFSFRNAQQVAKLDGCMSPITAVVMTPDQKVLIGGCENGNVLAWDVESALPVHNFQRLHSSSITAMDVHASAPYFASVSTDKALRIWDLRKKVCLQSYKDANASLCCVMFSPNGKWVATGCVNGTVRIYTPTTTRMEGQLQVDSTPITRIDFHPEFDLLAIGCASGSFAVGDVKNLKVVTRCQALCDSIDAILWRNNWIVAVSRKKIASLSLDNLEDPIIMSAALESLMDAVVFRESQVVLHALQCKNSRSTVVEVCLADILQKKSSSDLPPKVFSTNVLASEVEQGVRVETENIMSTLDSRLEHVREVRELWVHDQVGALQHIKHITERENTTSILWDFLTAMQQQKMKEKITFEAVPFLIHLILQIFEMSEEYALLLLSLRTLRSMNTKFRARSEEGIRRAKNAQSNGYNDPLGLKYSTSVVEALRRCSSSLMPLVTRVDAVGTEARQLIQELPP